MSIVCPYCGYSMKVKAPQPGRYQPSCKSCERRFRLTIVEGAPPRCEPLDDDTPRRADGASSPPPTAAAPTAAPPPNRADSERTVDFAAAERTVDFALPAQVPLAPTEATLPHPPSPPTPARPSAATMGATSGAAGPISTRRASEVQRPSIPPGVVEPSGPPVDAPKPTAPNLTAPLSPGATRPVIPSDVGATAPFEATQAAPLPDSARPSLGTAPMGRGAPTAIGAGSPGAAVSADMPSRLGGYKLLRELGRGAMGAVYLARQLSLDRDVALKLVQSQWVRNPTVLARFTREAYAAAQLTHHNVVQIYDLGTDQGTNFFSMEFVRGHSLADEVAQRGRLDPELAVTYVLQAARGLQAAHNEGMVHRDIKPANLLLNDQAVIKVADLGLVKVPARDGQEELSGAAADESLGAVASAELTLANNAMGTAAYMAPEQAEDASSVDHRADIYSLGCTLYVLLTGRPPFEGASALEVITKHKSQPVVRPEVLVERIPRELSEIVVRMVAKRPEDRYATMGEVIEALEGFLGVRSGAAYSPTEEHARRLEAAARAYHESPAARRRQRIGQVFLLGAIGLAVLLAPFRASWSLAAVGLLLSTVASYFIVSGLRERSHLFERARELVFASRWTDWLAWGAGALLALVALFALGALGIWIGVAAVGVGLGIAYHLLGDRPLHAERSSALGEVEALLRELRLHGGEEGAIRQFVAKYSGNDWEELFEELFGYPAMRDARRELAAGAGGRRRRKFRGWRDPLVDALESRLREIRELRERRHLQQVEQRSLEAQGVDSAEARERAERMAEALVDEALRSRQAALEIREARVAAADPQVTAEQKRARMKQMLAEARADGAVQRRRGRTRRALNLVAGARVRLLLGALLLTGCLLWMRQNGLLNREALQQVDVQEVGAEIASPQGRPLSLPLVGAWFDSYRPGVAGLLLLFSALFSGWRMSLFAIPGALLMVAAGRLGVPDVGGLSGATIGLLAGAALSGVGLLLGRTSDTEL